MDEIVQCYFEPSEFTQLLTVILFSCCETPEKKNNTFSLKCEGYFETMLCHLWGYFETKTRKHKNS